MLVAVRFSFFSQWLCAKNLSVSSVVLLLLLLLSVQVSAQNKKELEDKRKKLTREIEVTNKLLKKTTQTKAATYDRFITLQNQIDRRENLIETIENEIVAADESLGRNATVIESLTRDVEDMKTEYGHMIRAAYRRKTLTNPLLFILSAESLNQAFRRILFLRKYDRYRKGQAEAIAFTKEMLTKKINSLAQARQEKEDLLLSMQGQRTTLSTEMTDKNEMLQSLNKDEVRLQQELQQKQRDKINLDAALERIIAVEITKKADEDAIRRRKAAADKAAAEKAKVKPAPEKPKPTAPVAAVPKATTETPATKPAPAPAVVTTPVTEVLDEDDDALSKSFKKQRGRLAAPVDDGIIARAFGRQKHPTLKNIEITNNGVDIRTDEDAPVHAVFEGRVAGVQYIPGHEYTIILQHGNYYTVYANLSQTTLTKGDMVGAGQTLGRVITNPISGAAELHFELWHNKERMNPAGWIK